MLVGTTLRNERRGIHATYAWKTTRPIYVLGLQKAQNFVTQQQPAVLTNPFQHGQNLTQASASTEGGSQGPSSSSNNPTSMNVYMVKGDAFISTRAHDYSKPSTSEKGKEAKLPSLPL
jgi:hypothetical protein